MNNIKITIRKRKITKNRESLYLDFYPAIEDFKTGKFKRHMFLKLYVNSFPSTKHEKSENEQILKLAEEIRLSYLDKLNKGSIYNEYERKLLRQKEKNNLSFIEYFNKLKDNRYGINFSNWQSGFYYFSKYIDGDIKFNELTIELINNYKGFLLNSYLKNSNTFKLKQNTASSYFNKLRATLRQAYTDGFLEDNLNAKIKGIPEQQTKREHLTKEELDLLIQTKCNDDLTKHSSLFSALTGLRFSDIQKLKWSEIVNNGNNYYIEFTQKKTQSVESLPISEQAFNLLEKQSKNSEYVFDGLNYYQTSKNLKKWISNAGIKKKISFHNLRHTYATLQLFNGTDITTVSKMLGHKDIKTTMIYAKTVDEAKIETINRIVLNGI